jgi:hypothetical protein
MKTGHDALSNAENEPGSAKLENETRRTRFRRKLVRAPSVSPKTSPGAQIMKTGPDALGNAENEFGSAKHKNVNRRPRYRRKRVRARKTLKRDATPSVPPKTSRGAQNMKTGPDALKTAENESGSEKHENGTRRPQYRRKRVRERKT